LASYSCFQLSLERLWLPLMRSSLPPDHHRASDLSGLEHDGPSWVSLALSILAVSLEILPPAWLFQEPADLSGLYQSSPPCPAVKFPLSVSLGRLAYVIYWVFHCIYQSTFNSNTSFSKIQFSSNSAIIFCINIRLLYRILILKMFSRYFDPVEVNLLFSTIINIASQ
jgi:hypothetical protein